ncbi:hypothetical protein M501DRAFT_257712 [Patellaria atrata CBS 101060]|uniref:GRF-type domain-containing protein n=1 Tax=Patellaria atrata CBS 101060 TaxID=1346257 RepID=A0A9P4S6S0_9PEZI|nr:hypothetical protein M501DRAFT_257712 [Patellaria atrata CBS 101060]
MVRRFVEGSFTNGQWHCACNKPAVRLQVKSNTANQGRYFQKCATDKCKFWWFENELDRKLQDQPSTSEPSSITPRSRRTGNLSSPPPPYSELGQQAPRTPTNQNGNRRAQGEEHAIAQGIESARQLTSERAWKAPRTGTFTTPAKRRFSDMNRDGNHEVPTPATKQGPHDRATTAWTGANAVRRTLFPPRTEETPINKTVPVPPSPVTPSSSQDRVTTGQGQDMVEEILDFLKEEGVTLSEEPYARFATLLKRYALNLRTMAKGRDAVRAAVNAKEETIKEMTYRISTLEARLEAEQANTAALTAEIEELRFARDHYETG